MTPELENAVLNLYMPEVSLNHLKTLSESPKFKPTTGNVYGQKIATIISLIKSDLIKAGFNANEVYTDKNGIVLPGWFRPTKNWDLLAFNDNKLVCAIDLKHISASFANILNQKIESAVGTSFDAAIAYQEHLLGSCDIPPVLGFVFIVRDCKLSRAVASSSPHDFNIDPIFENASYLDRIKIFCRRLRQKSLFHAIWLVFVDCEQKRVYEPDPSMTYKKFTANILLGLNMHKA